MRQSAWRVRHRRRRPRRSGRARGRRCGPRPAGAPRTGRETRRRAGGRGRSRSRRRRAPRSDGASVIGSSVRSAGEGGRGQEAEGDQVVERLDDRAGAERGEPPTGPGDVARGRPRARASPSRSLEASDGVVARPAVRRRRGRDQHVEEAVGCSNRPRARVPYGVVQAGRALERHLPVERGVDPGGDGGRVGEEVVASTPPVRSLSRSSAAATSSAAASQPYDVVGPRAARRRRVTSSEVPSSRAWSTAAPTRRALPARSSRSRSAISRPATVQAQAGARAPSGPATWPAPPVTTTDSGSGDPAHERQVGVA